MIRLTPNSWGTARSALLGTVEADILLVQETKVTQTSATDILKQAAQEGWRAQASPAIPGKGHTASGGAAVLARRGLGVSELPLEEATFRHRICLTVVNGICRGGIVVGTVYLQDSVGLSPVNRALLEELAQRLGRLRLPWVVWG